VDDSGLGAEAERQGITSSGSLNGTIGEEVSFTSSPPKWLG
jgi:hypothetical protein